MALKKKCKHLGVDFNDAYYKVMPITIDEDGSDGNGKLYKIFVTVNCYTDENKEYLLNTHTHEFKNIRGDEFNLGIFYSKLKTLDCFNGAIDV